MLAKPCAAPSASNDKKMQLTSEATLTTVTSAPDTNSLTRLLFNTLAVRSVLISTGDHALFLVLATAGVFEDVDGTHIDD